MRSRSCCGYAKFAATFEVIGMTCGVLTRTHVSGERRFCLVVVGGGYIAAEFSHIAARAGAKDDVRLSHRIVGYRSML
jgi:hypothetical protein